MTFDGTNKDDPFLTLQRNIMASFAQFARQLTWMVLKTLVAEWLA